MTNDQHNQSNQINKTYRLEQPHLVYYDFEQGSEQWIQIRNKFITASAIGQIIKGNKSADYRNLLAEKASNGEYRSFFGNTATKWGHKYEPVANMLFEYKNNVTIYEYGLIYNPKYPYLAVSPDGITSNNEMLEIKCPYSRKIDGKIKREYEHQIQQQLLVCEHEICNFLECKFNEISEEEFWNQFQQNTKEKGIIVQSLEDGQKYNHYSPIELSFNQEDLFEWYQLRKNELGQQLIKTSYWILDIYHCQQVKRENDWYDKHKSIIEQFWKDVEKTKIDGWQGLVNKDRSSPVEIPNECLI